jgi:hypothetical protein
MKPRPQSLYNQLEDHDVSNMLRVPICALLMTSLAAMLEAAKPPRPIALTIVLDFQGPHSERSVDAMKHELQHIMSGAPVSVSWRSATEVTGPPPIQNLVVFRFKGKCILEPVGYLLDERGPMAFTYSTDHSVQPFGEVACDQVTAAVRPAMWGSDFAEADFLLGRALGRVVAHELLHMLSKSNAHAREGLAHESLTGQQLIAPVLQFTPADLDRIYTLP